MSTLWRVLTRKKTLDPISVQQTQLGRVLNTFDLTALGIGSTLGVGVYVLAGHVAKDTAGPAVVLSFLIAAIASVFAGLCYAEFGARTPRAGSAYIYSYVCVGEFIAFVIGWNLILEYIIGSASVARGLSLYLDTLLNNTLQDTFIEIAPINISFMSKYFDFLAFGISIILAIALSFGMKESSWANNIFTILNLGVVIFVIIAGSIKADPKNWDLHFNTTTNSTVVGNGGFFPFGIEGMIKGAATCFYGFVGFDCIATTGEEVKNPQKAIPISIITSLFVIFLAYFGTSAVVTLMVPYYLQDPNAPIPHAFETIGWDVAKWIVAIGGIFGLLASLFGAMFPLPRIIYAMASDGIIFRFLGLVNQRFKTPIIGTLLAGLLTGLMGALFELKHLVNMMSIGTLLAYTIVAACVLLLSYKMDYEGKYELLRVYSDSSDDNSEIYSNDDDNTTITTTWNEQQIQSTNDEHELILTTTTTQEDNKIKQVIKQIFNCKRDRNPTKLSENVVTVQIIIYCIICLLIGLCAMYLNDSIIQGELWAIVLTSIVLFLAVIVLISIYTQPTSQKQLSFKVPLIPLIPALSILINIYLMLMLDNHTWIRFGIWMIIGIPTYFLSIKNQIDARNQSIITNNLTINGKLTFGLTNKSFENDNNSFVNDNTNNENKKNCEELEYIAVLDAILDKEDFSCSNSIIGGGSDDVIVSGVGGGGGGGNSFRKISIDTISYVSNVFQQEHVVAVVHCCSGDNKSIEEIEKNNDEPNIIEIIRENENEGIEDTNDDKLIITEKEVTEKTTQTEDDDNNKLNYAIPLPPPLPPPLVSPASSSSSTPPSTLPALSPPSSPLASASLSSPPPPPPPPPPLPLSSFATPFPPPSLQSLFNPNQISIPRPKKLQIETNQSPKTPPIDYSRENSINFDDESNNNNNDDNLKFDSEQYKKFREKLSKNLLKQILPTLKNNNTSNINNIEVSNEDIITESINKNEAKNKLELFAEKSPNFFVQPNINTLPSIKMKNGQDDKIINDNVSNKDNDELVYKNNMNEIFKSIRSRKRVSETIDTKKDNLQIEHND